MARRLQRSAAAPRIKGAKTKPTSPEDLKSASPTLLLDEFSGGDVEGEEDEEDECGTETASAVSIQCACSAGPCRLVLPLHRRIDARNRE